MFIRFKSKPTGRYRCDPRVRTMLVDDAKEHDSNMTSVAVKILSERYKVAVHTNGVPPRKTSPARRSTGDMLLNLPERLYKAIAVAAIRNDRSSVQEEIVHAFTDHYGL